MKDCLISVIVPAFNIESYIGECLSSILSQSLHSFEVIAVDDGSTDQTPEKIQQIATQDVRVRLIKQVNAGVSAARNRGVDESNAPFIAFVDGDDIVQPNFLSQLYRAIQDADMAVIGVENINNKQEWSPRRLLTDDRLDNHNDPLHLLKVFSSGAWAYPNWNKLFRKSIIQKKNIRFNENLAIGEDRIFNLQYLMHCTSVRTLSSMGYGYRLRQDSAYRGAPPQLLWANHCSAMEATENAMTHLPLEQVKALKNLFITSPTIHTAFPQLLNGLKASGFHNYNSSSQTLKNCLQKAQRDWFNPQGLTLSLAAYWLFWRYSRGKNSPAVQLWSRRIY